MADQTFIPTQDTLLLIDELLSDEYYVELLRDEKHSYGKFYGQRLKNIIYEDFWLFVSVDLQMIDWQFAAEKINEGLDRKLIIKVLKNDYQDKKYK